MVVNKQERECAIVDIAVAGDQGIAERVKKYKALKRDITRMWNTRTVQVIRKCDEGLGEVAGKLYTRISISLPPKTTLLGAERF